MAGTCKCRTRTRHYRYTGSRQLEALLRKPDVMPYLIVDPQGKANLLI